MKIHLRKILILRKALRKHLSVIEIRKIHNFLDAAIAIDSICDKAIRKNFRKLITVILAI